MRLAVLLLAWCGCAQALSVSVVDYLGPGWREGITDDTAALQAAVDAVGPYGGEVVLSGQHRIAGTVLIDKSGTFTLRGHAGGQGSVTRLLVSGSGPALRVGRRDRTWFGGFRMDGVEVKGNGSPGQTGIEILRENHNHIEFCTLQDFSGPGSVALLVDGTGDASVTSLFLNSKLRNNETGARLIDTTSWRFEGGFILGNSAYGIQQIRGDTIDISGANFDRNGVAVEVAGIGPRIMGGRFERNNVGVRVTGRNAVIFGNVFNQSGAAGSVAIDLATGSSRNKLALNQFVDVPASAWSVRDSGAGNQVFP